MEIKNLKIFTSAKSRRGQSVVEAAVAIGIILLIVTALVGMGIGALRSATLSKNRSRAIAYSQEAMEAIRSIRDRDYNELAGNALAGCCGGPPCTPCGPCELSQTDSRWECASGSGEILEGIFTRSFSINELAVGRLKITVSVGWSDSGGDHTVVLDSYLTDWR